MGVEHLKYYLINSKIILDDKEVNAYVCASFVFKGKGVVNTMEATKILNCSRQNINDLVKRKN